MKELLADNVSLCAQLEALPAHQQIFTGSTKPRLREIDNPLTWVSCFLSYAPVRTADVQTRNLLPYGCLIREAQHHSGPGWQEYDCIFQQQAALNQSVGWNKLNPSLHASTVLSYRAGPGRVCSLCHEPNHFGNIMCAAGDATSCHSTSPGTTPPPNLNELSTRALMEATARDPASSVTYVPYARTGGTGQKTATWSQHTNPPAQAP